MINQTITHYRITAKLGQGGMGEVYRATDTKLEREVAIKILPQEISDDPVRRKRFIREAKAASALNHPHVCVIYEVSETEDGCPFIAMEFLPGQTLDLLPTNKPLDDESVVEVGSQIADALDAANEAGIIHRDIKPANIHRDGRGRVKVLDFGLAKRTDSAPTPDASTAEHTEAGKLMGTPSYMSPEQTRCETLDHRSDLFSLGVLLYELSTGRPPFEGASMAETVEKITHAQPEAIARFNYSVCPELERIIRKCLEKKPDHRYQSARELLIDLKRLERCSSTREAVLSPKQKPWKTVATVAAVVPIACLLLGIWWSQGEAIPAEALQHGKSVAVVPFKSHEEFHILADGLGYELSGRLSQVPSIKRIAPFNSSDRLRGDDLDLKAIAEELEVSTLLRGRIERSPRQDQGLQVRAELINPYSNSLMWHGTYPYDSVKGLPWSMFQEMVLAIAEKLNIELSSEQEAALMTAHTESPEAYDYYLKGRYYWAKRGPDLWRAKLFFELALSFDSHTGQKKDSEFALAWVGLADTYTLLAGYGLMPPNEAYPRAIEYADRAAKINDKLGDAHSTLGLCRTWFQGDLSKAMESFKQAQKLNPQDVRAYYWQMWPLFSLGQEAGAVAACKKACRIDPLSDGALYHLCYAYWITGDFESAERAGTKLTSRTPDLWLGHMMLARAFLGKGNAQGAVEAAEKSVDFSERQPMSLGVLGQAYAAAGRTSEANDLLQELEAQLQTETSDRWTIIGLLIALDENDKAIEQSRHAVQQRHLLFWLHFWPDFHPLWKDPRFIDLVNQAGIVRYNPDTETFEPVEQVGN